MIRAPKVALLLETSGHYGRGLLRGIIRYSRLHGPWSLHIGVGHYDQGLPNADFNGIIVRISSVRQADEIKAAGLPAVVLEACTGELAAGNSLSPFSQVVTDSRAIAKMAAYHLVAQGLRSFAFCGFENCPWSHRREEAFQRVITAQGFSCVICRIDVHNWMRHGEWTLAFGREQRHLTKWLKSLPPLTGLMACNDMCGRQVLEVCGDVGVRVPAHLAVVAVDNDELICELSQPSLSSVALELENGGYEAARLLAKLMGGDSRHQAKQIIPVSPLRVVGRRSSEVVVKDDPLVADLLHFIKNHAARGIGVVDVVHEMAVSRRTLERRLFHVTGRTMLDEINLARLERAKCLLQETTLPVYRVANESGFANTRMFNRTFRQAEGYPPATFRRKLVQGAGNGNRI